MEQALVDGCPYLFVECRLERGCVFSDVADVFDDAEIDGRGGEGESVTVGGKAVEEGVGGCVVGLPFLPDDAGDAGEEGEEVELGGLREGGVVQVPGAFHFGGDCFVELANCHGRVDFVLVNVRGCLRKCVYV